MEGECDGDEAVGGEKSVDGEGAHPTVDVSPADVAEDESGNRKKGERGREDACDSGGLILRVSLGEAFVREAVMGHEQKHTRGGNDAGERGCEHADQDSGIDDGSEDGDSSERR